MNLELTGDVSVYLNYSWENLRHNNIKIPRFQFNTAFIFEQNDGIITSKFDKY